MKRVGMVINIRPEKIAEYRTLHADVWPDVLAAMQRHHIRNYSIYIKDHTLFGYLEYHGDDFAADMKQIGEDEATQRWWKLTDPCQEPWPTRAPGEWWAMMEEVFHMD
jgi:L-rhamnose mutarotase